MYCQSSGPLCVDDGTMHNGPIKTNYWPVICPIIEICTKQTNRDCVSLCAVWNTAPAMTHLWLNVFSTLEHSSQQHCVDDADDANVAQSNRTKQCTFLVRITEQNRIYSPSNKTITVNTIISSMADCQKRQMPINAGRR